MSTPQYNWTLSNLVLALLKVLSPRNMDCVRDNWRLTHPDPQSQNFVIYCTVCQNNCHLLRVP